MDAYIENPQDWGYQKMQEKNGAPKRNYATANTEPQQLVLTALWSIVVFTFLYFFIKDGVIANWEILSENARTQKNVFAK